MAVILSILGALLCLSVLVVVHEFGHFIVARALGFTVEEFAIGYGPKLYSKVSKRGTMFSIRPVPVGGFCRFKDEDDDLGDDPGAFNNQPAWKRLLVLLAGPVFNIVFAILVSIGVLWGFGDYAVVVDSVVAQSPAERAGIFPGDVLIEVAGQRVMFDFSAIDNVGASDPESLEVVVIREGERIPLTLRDIYDQQEGRNMMGVMLQYNGARQSFTFAEAFEASFQFMLYFVKQLLQVFGSIITTPSTVTDQMMGPVATISLIGEALRSNIEVILRFVLLISANLGVFNLLPLPGLDGGRLIFTGIEIVARRPVPRRVEGIIHAVGIALLFAFVLYLTFNDVIRMFGG